jgi:hypothetical protein
MTWQVMVVVIPGGYFGVQPKRSNPMRLAVLVVLLIAFTLYSGFVVEAEGYLGFITLALREKWGMQIVIDLFISLTIAWAWLRHDAKARGITAWPYQVATVFIGSIAVLAYLIHRELAGKRLPLQARAV